MTAKDLVLPWKSLGDGVITQVTKGLWVVRMGVVVNRPSRHKKYDDSYVSLTCMTGDSKSVLGYSLEAKRKFHKVFSQPQYMSLISDVKEHSKPSLVYEDQKVRLYRFNTNRNPSYWFLVRYRPSAK